ncbi:MAG: helix-turn-helix domain-containing protein [bacterium]
MKTIWDWSIQSEAERVIDTARPIANGFFHLHHFYPLPWTPKTDYLHQGVYLPTLSHLTLPDFWHRVLSYDDKNMSLPPQLADLHHAITQQLSTLQLTPPDYSALQAQWITLAPRFFRLLHSVAPYTPQLRQLTIHPTYFGTMGSFNWSDSNPTDIIVYLRVDQPATTLAECILTALTRPYLSQVRHSTWEESEFLVDYLLQETALAKLFPTPHYGTLAHLCRNLPAKIIQESTQFLRQIGAPNSVKQTFSLKSNIPHFGSCPLPHLTNRESLVMTKLIEKSPTPVTYDELADLLYPDPDKFSLAALTKCVERLRDKLESMGISRHYLATASGVGYYLKN